VNLLVVDFEIAGAEEKLARGCAANVGENILPRGQLLLPSSLIRHQPSSLVE